MRAKWVGALPTHASTELCWVIMGLRFSATKVMYHSEERCPVLDQYCLRENHFAAL